MQMSDWLLSREIAEGAPGVYLAIPVTTEMPREENIQEKEKPECHSARLSVRRAVRNQRSRRLYS